MYFSSVKSKRTFAWCYFHSSSNLCRWYDYCRKWWSWKTNAKGGI